MFKKHSTIFKKYLLILAYEERNARSVALLIRALIRASHPPPAWHYLIPFKFVFEFLSARREIRKFSMDFLFLRKLVLDAARDIGEGGNRQVRDAEVEESIRKWCSSNKLYSESMHQKQLALAALLFDHYSALLKAEGKSYESLIRGAYKTRAGYESFLRKLTAAEREIDQAVVEMRGGDAGLRAQISIKQQAINTIREKQ